MNNAKNSSYDYAMLITAAVALAAILSPIFVAIINNCHQTKVNKLEIVSNNSLKAFEKYLSCLEQVTKDQSADILNEYSKAFGSALLYASDSGRKIMIQIDDYVKNPVVFGKNNEIIIDSKKIDELCTALRADIKIKRYTL